MVKSSRRYFNWEYMSYRLVIERFNNFSQSSDLRMRVTCDAWMSW